MDKEKLGMLDRFFNFWDRFWSGLGQLWDYVGKAWDFLMSLMSFARFVGGKLLYVYQNVVHFPPFSDWYYWVPLWFLWYYLLTKPKTFAEKSDKALAKINEMALKLDGAITKIEGAVPTKILKALYWIILWVTMTPVMIFILLAKQGATIKILFVAAAINMILNRIPWWLSYGIVLTCLGAWIIWLRSPEDRKVTQIMFRKHGIWKGLFLTLVVHFVNITPKNAWKCPFCGYKKNPIDDKRGPCHTCKNCKAYNPSLPWKCKEGHENPGESLDCHDCGQPNPNRTLDGSPIPTYPTWLGAPAPQGALPPAQPAGQTIDVVECQHCHANVPRGNFCISCEKPLNGGNDKNAGTGRLRRRDMN